MERPEVPPSRPLLHPSESSNTTTNTINNRKNAAPTKEKKPAKSLQRLPSSIFDKIRAIPGDIPRGWNHFVDAMARLWRAGWTAEGCSCVFSIAALLGLVATLLAHQNKPLPDWPQIVGINSIVSLFSMLIRAAVGMVLAEGISQSKWQWFRKARQLSDMERFDNASRGAWGSVVFLFGLRIKNPYFIAAMGALITVMAAFTGFAAQQLIIFENCLRPDNSTLVGIHRTNLFDASGPRTAPRQVDEYLPMSVAMDIGMLQPTEDYTSKLSYGCETGNCTFPSTNGSAFSTVAIDYACEDVTLDLQVSILPDQIKWTYGAQDFGDGLGPDGIPIAMNVTSIKLNDTKFILPNGTQVRNLGLSLPMSDDRDVTSDLKFPLGYWLGNLVTGATTIDYGDTISTLKMIAVPDRDEPSSYRAFSCGLFPTRNTYRVKYHKAVLTEELVSKVRLGRDAVPWSEGAFALVTTQTLVNGTMRTCSSSKSRRPGYYTEPVSPSNVDASPQARGDNTTEEDVLWFPRDCLWAFTLPASGSVYAHLAAIFNDQFLVNAPGYGAAHGSAYMRQLYNDGNITLEHVQGFMKNMTTSMNAVVRTHGLQQPNYSVPLPGTQWYSTTCVRVNWTWIVFPATMIALSAVFLVLVAFESRGVQRGRLWKSSVLAMLFCDLDEGLREEVGSLGRRGMEKVAQSSSVCLGKGAEGLKLVGGKGFPTTQFFLKGLLLRAATLNPTALAPLLVDMIKSGRVDLSWVVSRVVGIEDIADGYSSFEKKLETKVVIRFPWEGDEWDVRGSSADRGDDEAMDGTSTDGMHGVESKEFLKVAV